MTQTQLVTTAMAAELLQSVGVELTIFVVSVALAVTFRGVAFGPFGGCQAAFNAPSPRPQRPGQSGAAGTSRGSSSNNKVELKPQHKDLRSMAPTEDLVERVDTMIDCASRRQASEALAIYEKMRATGEYKSIKDVQNRIKKRPSDTFALLIQCAVSVGRPKLVQILVGDMVAADIERSLGFYEATMKMLASKKCYEEALSICSHLEADGLEPSPVTLSCLVSFAVEIGELDRAISFFDRLAACGMPSIRAYMTILRVHSKRQDWTKSLALIQDMQKRAAPIDSLVLNIVLSTGVAARQLNAARALLEELSKVGIADVVSYNTVMKGLAQQKDVDEAITLLDEMSESGVKPNAITFNTAIDATVRGLRIADAWRILARMRDAGVAPDKFTCTTLMKGLQNGATSEQLMTILDLMRNVSEESKSSIWSFLFRSVIEAAAQVNDPRLTSRAVSQMKEQRVMICPQEYQRLLKALLRDA